MKRSFIIMETAKMIEELSKVFNKANEKWFEGSLPIPMIIVSRKSSKWEMGFITTSKIWKPICEGAEKDYETRYEINISAEGLSRPIENIIGTLVHEMVHEYNLINGIKDCSGKIHNKKFKAEAERVGLRVERTPQVGYGATTPSDEFIQEIKKWNIDKTVFNYVRGEVIGSDQSSKGARKKGAYKYTLPSDPKKHFKLKFEVLVTDPETGELFNKEYEPGDEE